LGGLVQLQRLTASDLRCFVGFDLSPGPGLNLFTGGNGAGKTSILEAVHLLGYGRSFRGRVRDGLIRSDQPYLELFAQWRDGRGQERRAGLRHSGQKWEARLDGEPAPSLSELCAELAVVTFEPGSHELIGGGSEHRRRFLDWALFHVEPSFLLHWRRYARALKQRNALLKTQPFSHSLQAWDLELSEAGEVLTALRAAYMERLEPVLAAAAGDFLPELGLARLTFQPGWRRAELPLADVLLLARDRDMASGFTSVGPHRADWRLDYAMHAGRETLSRGQEKLTALACVLAQAQAFAEDRGEWPVVCLDDLASELDQVHQRHVLERLRACGAQIWLTGTELPSTLLSGWDDCSKFHVEHGQITQQQ